MRFLMLLIVIGLVLSTLSGCGAVYKYNRTVDNCNLTIYSFREVGEGEIFIDDCNLKSGAYTLTTNTEALKTIVEVVRKLP